MKTILSLLTAVLMLVATASGAAPDVQPRYVTATTQGQVCSTLFKLASVNRSYIIRPYSNPGNVAVLTGIDFDPRISGISDTERLALLRMYACQLTGDLTTRQDMQPLGAYYVQPIGNYVNDALELFPTSGFGAISTLVTASKQQSCLDALNLANRSHRNDLIVRSFISGTGLVNYTAVVGDTWRYSLSDVERIATLYALQCYAAGGPGGRQDMILQSAQTGEVVGRFINSVMELY